MLDNTVFYIDSDHDWRLQKKGMSGFGSFEAKVTTTQDYRRDGGETENIRLTDKTRTLKICNIDWRNAENARNEAKMFFRYSAEYDMYITEAGMDFMARGRLTRMALPEPTDEDYLMKVTLTFQFDDPYFKSVDDFGRNIASLTPNAGFPYISRLQYGTATGIFNFERVVTIENDGDQIIDPKAKLTFIGPVLNPSISINDGCVKILGTFGVDDEIVLDFTQNPPTVRNNGVNILGMCDRSSNFDKMYIAIGKNIVSFDADNGTDEIRVYIYYNKSYTEL